MSSISSHTNTGGIPPSGSFGGIGTTTATQTAGTTQTQGVKSSLGAINDFIESLGDTVSTQGVYLKDPNQPAIPTPSQAMADGTVDENKKNTFKMPYDRNEKTIILQDFKGAIQSGLTAYVQSLNLPANDAAALLNKLSQGFVSMSSGKAPQLPPAELQSLQNIVKQATGEIQKLYGLPKTWQATSKDSVSWTPVAGAKTNGVDPLRLGQVAVMNGFKAGMADMMQMQKTGQNLLANLPPNDPKSVEMKDFLKAVGEAIQKFKEFLFYEQSMDAKRMESTNKIKLNLTESQIAMRSKQMDNLQMMMAKQKVMGAVGLAIKIIGPILSAICTVVSAGLVVVGALTSWLLGAGLLVIAVGLVLGAIGVLIGTAATIYSVVDSCTNCTQLLFTAIDNLIKKAIESANQGQDIPWLRDCIEVAIILAVTLPVLAALIVVAIGAPQVAGEEAVMTTEQIVRAIVFEIIEQISLQILMNIIVPAVIQVSTPLFKDIGLTKLMAQIFKCSEETASMVLEICVTAFVMFASLAISMRAGRNANALNKNANLTRNEIDASSSLMKLLKSLSGAERKDGLSVANVLSHIGKLFEVTELGFRIAGSITNGLLCLQMADLQRKKGDIDAAEESLQGMIDVANKVLKQIESQLSNEGSITTSFSNMQEKMFKQYSQVISQLFS